MDKETNHFCSSCSSSYTVVYSVSKNELFDTPEFCPFCGQIVTDDENDTELEELNDDE